MAKKFTADIRVAIPPTLRERLEVEAHRQRRTLSGLIRVLLEQSLCTFEATPDPIRSEYEIKLTTAEFARLKKRGYGLTDE